MGYQLVVWEGERPDTDADGQREFQAMTQQHLIAKPTDPTPAIRRFVEELGELWTHDPNDPEWVNSPWKCCPVLDEASGPVIFLHLTLEAGVIASMIIASVAEKHGLVAYDLMTGWLRPVSEEVIAQQAQRWTSSLN